MYTREAEAPAEPPILLTVPEAARLLSVGKSTMYRLIANGDVPGVKRIRGTVRISRAVLEEWAKGAASDLKGDEDECPIVR